MVAAARMLAATLAIGACALTAGGGATARAARATRVIVHTGDDWRVPAWVRPSANSGLYSEDAAPSDHVDVRSVDVSWRQIEPRRHVLDLTRRGRAQGLAFAPLADQLKQPGQYWMRIFASGVDWAPPWVRRRCQVATFGPDYDHQRHLPIWNACVWRELMWAYRELFVRRGLRASPNLLFVYVPGAFTWAEFDYDIIAQAARHGLTFTRFNRWFQAGMRELSTTFGPYAPKLVFTGEDYPFGPYGKHDDLLARDAVATGMGIRNGIPEDFNFHLDEVPAYGSTIAPNGHLVTDERWPLLDGKHVVGMENECFTDCGFTTKRVAYAVKMTNLKSLQLRANWIYVVPGPSYLRAYAPLWRWTRLELGKTAETTPDAWVALRDAQDRYFLDDRSRRWKGFPYIRNLERFLVQRDVAPDGTLRRGTDRLHVFDPENGVAYEGLRTDIAHGQTSVYLDLDDRIAQRRGPLDVLVTFRTAAGALHLDYPATGGLARGSTIASRGAGWQTAVIRLTDAAFDGSLPGRTDLRVVAEGADVEVRFVRMVWAQAPAVTLRETLPAAPTAARATISAPKSVRVGQRVVVRARGVDPGRRVLVLAAPHLAGSPSDCSARLPIDAPPSAAVVAHVRIPAVLQCRLPDGTPTARVAVRPGRYFFTLCLRLNAFACDGSKTFLRTPVRVEPAA